MEGTKITMLPIDEFLELDTPFANKIIKMGVIQGSDGVGLAIEYYSYQYKTIFRKIIWQRPVFSMDEPKNDNS